MDAEPFEMLLWEMGMSHTAIPQVSHGQMFEEQKQQQKQQMLQIQRADGAHEEAFDLSSFVIVDWMGGMSEEVQEHCHHLIEPERHQHQHQQPQAGRTMGNSKYIHDQNLLSTCPRTRAAPPRIGCLRNLPAAADSAWPRLHVVSLNLPPCHDGDGASRAQLRLYKRTITSWLSKCTMPPYLSNLEKFEKVYYALDGAAQDAVSAPSGSDVDPSTMMVSRLRGEILMSIEILRALEDASNLENKKVDAILAHVHGFRGTSEFLRGYVLYCKARERLLADYTLATSVFIEDEFQQCFRLRYGLPDSVEAIRLMQPKPPFPRRKIPAARDAAGPAAAF